MRLEYVPIAYHDPLQNNDRSKIPFFHILIYDTVQLMQQEKLLHCAEVYRGHLKKREYKLLLPAVCSLIRLQLVCAVHDYELHLAKQALKYEWLYVIVPLD